jgi:hypothetical protein
MVYIGPFKILSCFLSTLFDSSLLIFYTYAYSTLVTDLKAEPSSIIFAIYIGLAWMAMYFSVKPLFICIKYYGETIEDDIWNLLSVNSKVYQLFSVIIFLLSIYFMVVIGPFFSSCGIYDNSEVACIALQLISLFGFIESCCLALSVIVTVGCYCLVCYGIISITEENKKLDESLMSQFLQRYNPIPAPESSDNCGICLDDDKDKEWTELTCKHVFHRECLGRWFVYNQTCPYCRNQISLVEAIKV